MNQRDRSIQMGYLFKEFYNSTSLPDKKRLKQEIIDSLNYCLFASIDSKTTQKSINSIESDLDLFIEKGVKVDHTILLALQVISTS